MAILETTHWRDSARRPRFFAVDAFAVFPLLFFCLYPRLISFLITLAIILFFAILERFHFTLPVFFRWLRAQFAGPFRFSKPWWRK